MRNFVLSYTNKKEKYSALARNSAELYLLLRMERDSNKEDYELHKYSSTSSFEKTYNILKRIHVCGKIVSHTSLIIRKHRKQTDNGSSYITKDVMYYDAFNLI